MNTNRTTQSNGMDDERILQLYTLKKAVIDIRRQFFALDSQFANFHLQALHDIQSQQLELLSNALKYRITCIDECLAVKDYLKAFAQVDCMKNLLLSQRNRDCADGSKRVKEKEEVDATEEKKETDLPTKDNQSSVQKTQKKHKFTGKLSAAKTRPQFLMSSGRRTHDHSAKMIQLLQQVIQKAETSIAKHLAEAIKDQFAVEMTKDSISIELVNPVILSSLDSPSASHLGISSFGSVNSGCKDDQGDDGNQSALPCILDLAKQQQKQWFEWIIREKLRCWLLMPKQSDNAETQAICNKAIEWSIEDGRRFVIRKASLVDSVIQETTNELSSHVSFQWSELIELLASFLVIPLVEFRPLLQELEENDRVSCIVGKLWPVEHEQ